MFDVHLTQHAKQRMRERGWTPLEVFMAIASNNPRVVTQTVIKVITVLPKQANKAKAKEEKQAKKAKAEQPKAEQAKAKKAKAKKAKAEKEKQAKAKQAKAKAKQAEQAKAKAEQAKQAKKEKQVKQAETTEPADIGFAEWCMHFQALTT